MGADLGALAHALSTMHLGHHITLTATRVVIESPPVLATDAQSLDRTSFDLQSMATVLADLSKLENERGELQGRLEAAGLWNLQ